MKREQEKERVKKKQEEEIKQVLKREVSGTVTHNSLSNITFDRKVKRLKSQMVSLWRKM